MQNKRTQRCRGQTGGRWTGGRGGWAKADTGLIRVTTPRVTDMSSSCFVAQKYNTVHRLLLNNKLFLKMCRVSVSLLLGFIPHSLLTAASQADTGPQGFHYAMRNTDRSR